MQKFKSWQGRLKKIEAQLKAEAAKMGQPAAQAEGEAIEEAGKKADPTGDTGLAAAAENLGEQVESGAITPEEAMSQLASDFGQPFVNAIQAVVKMFAGQEMGSVKKDTADIIDHLTSKAKQDHFNAIHGAHPDFAQIHDDPRFKAWVAENGKQDVVDHGSASDINKMLSDYKAATGAAPGGDTATQDGGPVSDEGAAGDYDPTPAETAKAGDAPGSQGQVDEGALDDAEAVRTSGHGMRLPEHPKKGGDFESAWNEF